MLQPPLSVMKNVTTANASEALSSVLAGGGRQIGGRRGRRLVFWEEVFPRVGVQKGSYRDTLYDHDTGPATGSGTDRPTLLPRTGPNADDGGDVLQVGS